MILVLIGVILFGVILHFLTNDTVINEYSFDNVNYDEYELATGISDKDEQIKKMTEDYMSLLEEDILSMYTEEDFREMIKFGKLPINEEEELGEISLLLCSNDLASLKDKIAKFSVFILKDLVRRLYIMKLKSYEDCRLLVKNIYEKAVLSEVMCLYNELLRNLGAELGYKYFSEYFINMFQNNKDLVLYRNSYKIRKILLAAFDGNKKINKKEGSTLAIYYTCLDSRIRREILQQFEESEFLLGIKTVNTRNIFDVMRFNGYASKTGIYDENKQIIQIGIDYYALADRGLRAIYTIEDFITVMKEGKLPMEPYPYYKDRLLEKGIDFAERMLENKSIEEQKKLLANYIGYVLHDSRKRDCAMRSITFEEYQIFSDKLYLSGKSRNSSHDDLSNPKNLFEYCMKELYKSTHKYRSGQDIIIFIGRYLNKLYGDEKWNEREDKIGCDLKKGLLNEFYEFPEVRKELYVY